MGLVAKSEERTKGRSQGGWQLPGEGLCSSTTYLTPVLRGRLQPLLLLAPCRGHPECPPCVLPLGWQPQPGTPHPWEESPWSWGSSPLHLTSTLVQPVCTLHNPVAKWPSLRNFQEHRATEGQPSAKSLPSPGKHIKSCRNHWSSTRFGEQAPNSDRSACAVLLCSHKPSLETWKPLLD